MSWWQLTELAAGDLEGIAAYVAGETIPMLLPVLATT